MVVLVQPVLMQATITLKMAAVLDLLQEGVDAYTSKPLLH
jgi:hypothetical protein